MNNIRIYLILLFLGVLFFTCKKETPQDDNNNTTTEDKDPPQYETPFSNIPATNKMVLYEINERAFSSNGDLKGILPRLDSIKALGVNTIWLMPIHPIGAIKSVNSPYSVKNYKEINPEYGTLDDLRNLVREAHKRDIAVILDWVANHTAWDNPWVLQHKGWYSQDGSGNIIIPPGTNWQDVADLNFDNQDMRQAMIKALKYWILTANVDGYRCDAADMVPADFWKQAIDSIRAIKNRTIIMLAEGGRADHLTVGFDMNFGWEYFSKLKDVFRNNVSASQLLTAHNNEYNNIPAGHHRLRFTSNHDECAWDDTPIGLFGGNDGAMAAFVLSAYMGGVPLIYNGQEIGYPVKLPFFSKSPINWSYNPAIFARYKQLMYIRTKHPAFENTTLLFYNHNDIAVFIRKNADKELTVLVNIRKTTVNYTIPNELNNTQWKNVLSDTLVNLNTQITLQPYQYLILSH